MFQRRVQTLSGERNAGDGYIDMINMYALIRSVGCGYAYTYIHTVSSYVPVPSFDFQDLRKDLPIHMIRTYEVPEAQGNNGKKNGKAFVTSPSICRRSMLEGHATTRATLSTVSISQPGNETGDRCESPCSFDSQEKLQFSVDHSKTGVHRRIAQYKKSCHLKTLILKAPNPYIPLRPKE